MSQAIIDLLERGQDACRKQKLRAGNLISLPARGSLVITGDIHGHRRNFERIVTFADLANKPERYVILQEIIHGGCEDDEGGCLSYELLFDAIRYMLEYPDRVHLIMGNHDTTFINNTSVMKSGREMNAAIRKSIERKYGNQSTEIDLALRQFLFSQPLAVRCANRLWISHSLPADRFLDQFDPGIFNRTLKVNDVVKPGSAYLLTWGRRMSQSCLGDLAKKLDVDMFVVGHQPSSKGYRREADNLVIVASDHNHGCILPIDLARSYNADELIECLVPLASIA